MRTETAREALHALNGRSPTDANAADVIAAMRAYLHLPSSAHVLFSLAVAVSARLAGDPLWGLLVGPPSSAKTEMVRALDGVADEHLNEITTPGLLGWTGSASKGRPTGMLTRLGPVAFATIADLSSLLAMSDKGYRDNLYALFRRAYDGQVVREIGSAPEPLRWEGRLTLLAAVTPAVDNYASHADALGPRWLYLRLPQTDTATRRESSRMARENAPSLAQHRARVRGLAERTVDAAVSIAETVQLAVPIAEQLDDAAIVTCLGRAAVEREGYGKREISSIPVIEEPPRLSGQLAQLGRGLLGLGVGEEATVGLCRRAALDSMPQARRGALAALAQGEELTAAQVARHARCDRKVARFALEEMAAVGLCRYRGDESDDEDEPRRSAKPWRLDGPDAALVAATLMSDQVCGRWDEKCPPPTHPPLLIEREPPFRPTSEDSA